MDITKTTNVGELVAQDYRAAGVFKAHKIDFCCNGNRTVAEVCEKKGLNADELLNELQSATSVATSSNTDFASWDMDLLADYIVKKHHRYVEKSIPDLKAYLNKIVKVHGDEHPELAEIEQLFLASAGELTQHMKKEELMLFPFIQKLATNSQATSPVFNTVENPIEMMKHEHDQEGERFRKIAELSDDYTPPAEACNTYRVTFALLKEFEDDLHEHIHLENNILFPKAIKAEQRVNYA